MLVKIRMSFPRTRYPKPRTLFLPAAFCVVAFALYAADVPHNPPGFYIDESSIAYNAHAVARTGRDEYGESWPLYFRAFGDYKNPTYVYLLAAVFRVTGPNVTAARLLSAALGALAALLLGLLALRVSGRVEAGAVVACSALLTPWLYESSRLVLEAAAYPTACALFLVALWRAATKERWAVFDVLALACALALLTYTYSIGRLLGPLLAAGRGAAARIPYDMEPGDTAGLRLEVSAPEAPGEYVLELDVVQEGVARFGARGSQALRARVTVTLN